MKFGIVSLVIFSAFVSMTYGADVQKVRTPFLPDLGQVPLEELERQQQEFPDLYYLQGKEDEKVIALTFDDGPSPFTKPLLAVLERNNVQATFFWMGSHIIKNQQIARKALAAGHVIGNHSWSHPYLNELGDEWWDDEFENTQNSFDKVLGKKPALMRPPYGFLLDNQIAELANHNMKAVQWSVASDDWYASSKLDELKATEAIVKQVLTYAHPGAIVLMHDAGGNTRMPTVRATEIIITSLRTMGYRFVTVDKLLGVPAYQ